MSESTPAANNNDSHAANTDAAAGLRARAGFTVAQLKDTGTAFIHKLRWKALGWTLAALLTAFATISFIGGGWIPVLSVALAAAVVSVSRVASSLDQSRCMTCGTPLPASASPDVYGVSCGTCGAINDRVPRSNDERPGQDILAEALADTSGDLAIDAPGEPKSRT